jgi:Histidine kinase-, DNA gyrase B-, and HSP90-like ATPase
MSIAAMQRHLAVSSLNDVAVRPYFVQLCESLAVSMIPDPNVLSIEVTVDDSVVDANKSVSLGLIVTELVINALKHGFTGHARGKIVVDCRSHGADWSLSVKDDGVGMPTGTRRAKAGLGTGIIEALTKHLGACFQVIASNPGVAVAISRDKEMNRRRRLGRPSPSRSFRSGARVSDGPDGPVLFATQRVEHAHQTHRHSAGAAQRQILIFPLRRGGKRRRLAFLEPEPRSARSSSGLGGTQARPSMRSSQRRHGYRTRHAPR